MSYSHLNQPLVAANVHSLVTDILANTICFNEIINQLNELYYPFMTHLNTELFYSQPVVAFVHSTNAIVGDSYPVNVIWDHDKTQHFINMLSCYRNDIERERITFSYQESQNRNNLANYVGNLTTHYSKLLFIRIDLKYAQQTSHHVSIEDFDFHMSKFRELIGNKKTCFEHLQGNAWALEQGGIEGGLHCHLLLIYDGSERQNDWYLAKEVGEKWKEVTAGLGEYYSYHDKERKQQYRQHGKLGIGMIHRDNPQEVENAVASALYLTKPSKSEQQLKLWLPNMRTFGHGIYRTKKRRGLPPISK
ncbi:YagK/YfjJ domain-containing protein [Psychrobacter nivimaris]|uniref:YagK/YfjJ domain-containing protein n=1 Tax=Psychrobacter nivimaris TaxID=281738 RepID=UPI001917D993|nr:inovirus-type Gp2 protein [Psychrobacter nivimaris]